MKYSVEEEEERASGQLVKEGVVVEFGFATAVTGHYLSVCADEEDHERASIA